MTSMKSQIHPFIQLSDDCMWRQFQAKLAPIVEPEDQAVKYLPGIALECSSERKTKFLNLKN